MTGATTTASALAWTAADGTRIAARLWQPKGEAAGAVCLVHGLGEHGGRYDHVAARLGQAGFAVLAPDMRGHGLSGGARGHATGYDVLLDDVDGLLAQGHARFAGLPLFLYGHSLGGNIVLCHVLRRHPAVTGAIATSPLLQTAFRPPAWKLAAGKLLYRLAPTLAMPNGLRAADLSHDPAVVSAYTADPLVHDRVSARLALDMLAAGQWAIEHAADLAVPLLLLHGSTDRICSPEASRRFAATADGRCTYVEFPGLYHETHNELRQAEVLDTISHWVGERLVAHATG